jgi:hypothetical protein
MKITKVTQQDYEILLDKYHKKNTENKKLKFVIEQMIKANQEIEKNYKSTVQLYEVINNSIQQLKKDQNSTISTTSTFNTGNTGATVSTSDSSNIKQCYSVPSARSPNKTNYQKKLEDMEINYNEMVKNFGLLVNKYKIIKEDRDNLEESNNLFLDQMKVIKMEKDKMQGEYSYHVTQKERHKEIDRCLVDTLINSYILNSTDKKDSSAGVAGNVNSNTINNLNVQSIKNSGPKYITCEPVPTFVRFINKYSDVNNK